MTSLWAVNLVKLESKSFCSSNSADHLTRFSRYVASAEFVRKPSTESIRKHFAKQKTWRRALPMLERRRRKSSRELSISLTRTLIPRLTSSRELQSQRELFFCYSFSRFHTTVGWPIRTHRASFCALNLQTCSALRAFSAWQTFNRRRFTSLHARSFFSHFYLLLKVSPRYWDF